MDFNEILKAFCISIIFLFFFYKKRLLEFYVNLKIF